MNKLSELLSQSYKSFEQKEAIALLEKIETAVEGMDKGCEYCKGSYCITCSNCLTSEICIKCKKKNKYKHHIFCPNCGRDLRKEENK